MSGLQDQARRVLSLLSDLGGQGASTDIQARSQLTPRQLERALPWLDALEYVQCRVNGRYVYWRITPLGLDAMDLVQELEQEL